jgi:hypothetical protein
MSADHDFVAPDADPEGRGDVTGATTSAATRSAEEHTFAEWEQSNGRYLSAALEWLRLRLRQADPEVTASPGPASVMGPPPEAPPTPAHRQPRWRRSNGDTSLVVNDRTVPPGNPEPSPRATATDAADAFRRMEELRSASARPAMAILVERLGLTRFEEQVLLLCVGMDLDPQLGWLCARAYGDHSRPYPTFALAMSLFDDAAWAALSPERPLRLWRLVEIIQPAAEPLTTSALRADERIVSFIKGLNYLDERLAPLLVPFDLPAGERLPLPSSQQDVVNRVVAFLHRALDGPAPPVVQLVGADSLSRQLVVSEAAAQTGLHLSRLPAELLPKDSGDLVLLSRLWERESMLLPLALYIDLDLAERTSGEQPERETRTAVRRFLDRTRGVFFVGIREVMPQLGLGGMSVDVEKPRPLEQRRAWKQVLPDVTPQQAAVLAGQFDLNTATIDAVARSVGADLPEDRLDQLWHACLNWTRPRLDVLGHRLIPKASWEDIVLSSEARRLLNDIADQVHARSHVYDEWGFRRRMSRGLGITALFAGDSGTGKTMAAEVLANELRLNLYRIDLSAVVSKYIGETEKNLREVFDAAEDGGAILFFDEADALFGKRSEVKDSHDRYANIEVNYLLQRMEAFEGLAILATNLRNALDRAFLRRLRFVVTFPFPGADERAEIWRRVFPTETPLGELDFTRLGRLTLTGGSIHNVALNAAFAAARRGGEVTMALVLEAARGEFRKIDKPINEAEFRLITPRAVVG